MSRVSILFQLGLADFRERTRRYSFLMMLLGVLFFGYLVITGKYTIQFGDLRPEYDAAWAGSLMAVCASIMLAIFGFYLVRGGIQHDRKTEIGQILASTPISRSTYLVSKFVSNVLVFWVIIVLLAVVAFFTLLFRNEGSGIDLWGFVSPFFLIAVPVTAFVAAMAILFGSVRWLRGSLGNILYLFAAEFCVVFGMLEVSWLDLAAVALFTNSATAAAALAFPGEKIGLLAGFVMFDEVMQVVELRTFPWSGVEWTAGALLQRVLWLGIAFGTLSMAIPLFDRFDPARVKRRMRRWKDRGKEKELSVVKSESKHTISYTEVCTVPVRFRLLSMVSAELRLALKGYHWFWYAVAIGLAVAQVAAPFEVARHYLVPASMVWPLVIWSSMGTRESQYNTSQLLFSCPRPVTRQLPAVWLSGVMVALAAIAPMTLRAFAGGEMSYSAALIVSAILVPSVALAMGITSGSRKLFEVIYLMVWYVGSIDRLTPLDLLGTTEAAVTGGRMVVCATVAAISLGTAFLTRRLRIVRD